MAESFARESRIENFARESRLAGLVGKRPPIENPIFFSILVQKTRKRDSRTFRARIETFGRESRIETFGRESRLLTGFNLPYPWQGGGCLKGAQQSASIQHISTATSRSKTRTHFFHSHTRSRRVMSGKGGKTSFKALLSKSGSNPTVSLQSVRAQRDKLQQLKHSPPLLPSC